MKENARLPRSTNAIYRRIREILESARGHVTRSVNTTQVMANWLIGREIVEEEQKGKARAEYGEGLVRFLSAKLQTEYGAGYSLSNIKLFRNFYIEYPLFLSGQKGHAVRGLLPENGGLQSNRKSHAVRGLSWRTGLLHPNLSWTHYRTLLQTEKPGARAFYEIEAIKNKWSARELERQKNSLLYERLALSRDKKGLMRLAVKGHEVQYPMDVFKDPTVIEFLGFPKSPKLVETKLEESLVSNLQSFLLELGKGFAFVSRQERITLDGDHFYIDLVFYHTILKCYILIDLKAGKLTHQDIGQLQLYVNYYDLERRSESDNPTLGLILCADKNDTVVRYTLGPEQRKTIFASRYKLHLPSETELKMELRREIQAQWRIQGGR